VYCSTCGVAVSSQNLSYCNHCGAKLIRGDSVEKAPEVKPEMLVAAMVGTFIFGLIAIAVLIGVLKNVLGIRVEPIMLIMTLLLLFMAILESVFIRLLLRGRRGAERKALPDDHVTNELDAARERLLSEPRASVTENTTRAFEPVRKRE